MRIKITINGKEIEALVDTGSQPNLLRNDVYQTIGKPDLKKADLQLHGFGQSYTIPKGYFTTQLEIDGDDFETKFYVVSDDAMKFPAMIGNDLLEDAELIVNRNGVHIIKSSPNQELPTAIVNIVEKLELDIGDNVDEGTKRKVEEIVNKYIPNKIKSTDVETVITVKDEEPVYSSPRRMSPSEKKILDEQVQEWIEKKIVEPCVSEYASPVVIAWKKDRSPRVCIDYHRLNKKIYKDRYPLPLIEDLLDKLRRTKVFSILDLKSGFFHVPVAPDSRKYTAFVTSSGQYWFLKTPMGLSIAPPVFQRYINTAFRQLVQQGTILVYMDDIIILALDENEALERLQIVLKTASEYGLELNLKKLKLLKKRIEFLGYIVEKGSISPSPDKTLAVIRFPEPKSYKQVQSFLGLTGYFRKFIPRYSILAKPLSDLLKKDVDFQFGRDQRIAFNKLKELLSEKPVLQIYHPDYETEVHTDASKDGYGAVLLQKSPEDGKIHPVYYMSKKTTPAESNYSSYDLEVLAVIMALKKFRVYLLGIKFDIITDCSAFQRTMDKKDIIPRITRWALMLEEFEYTIKHRSGTRMQHVDALSRFPVMYALSNELTTRIKRAQLDDEKIKAIIEVLKEKPYEDYTIIDGILFKFSKGNDLLVVPKGMQTEIIRNSHERGHFSVKKTEEIIRQDYYISNLNAKIIRVIENCIKCIINNKKAGRKEGLLHPIFKGSLPFQTYQVDHVGPMESTHKGYNHLFVVVDSFTKFVWVYPVKSTTSREVINKLELQKTTFGNPSQIVADRGTAFTSQEFKDYCISENIELKFITTGLPRANGQVERVNAIIVNVLAKLSTDNPTKWYQHVAAVQRAINSTYQRSIKRTPFELLTGARMRDKTDLKITELLQNEVVDQFDAERDIIRKEAIEQISKLQDENRRNFNKHRRKASQHRVGDLVAIKRTQLGPGLKLKPKYLGPYRIAKVKANDTYDVIRDGAHEGPKNTTTCAEYLKRWRDFELSSESDDSQEGRVWETMETRRRESAEEKTKEREDT